MAGLTNNQLLTKKPMRGIFLLKQGYQVFTLFVCGNRYIPVLQRNII